jgi:hypothetical protein
MRSLWLVPILLLAMAVTAGPAVADQSQHTTRLSLSVTATGTAAGYPELQSGQVVNTHTSGPVNFAIENYMVNGAKPDTSRMVLSSRRTRMVTPTDRPRSRLPKWRHSGFTTLTGASSGRSSRVA